VVKPVRIAFVITELEFGGAERCLTNLVTRIDRTRFDPIVCALKPRPAAGEDQLVQQIESANVPVHFLNLQSPASLGRGTVCRKSGTPARQKTAKSGRPTFRNFKLYHYSSLLSGVSSLKRLLRQHDAEIVQTFLFHANVIGAFAAKSAGVARIYSGIRVADPSRWRMMLERFAMRRVDGIVCVSQSVADQMASKLGIPQAKLQVIPNGIDLSNTPERALLDKTQFGIAAERRILLCVGRLHEQKGFDWLLALAPELFRRLPEHDVVILGEGPERNTLSELAIGLGIQDRVHLVGWRADVPQWMHAAEMLLLPSRWEGMPNVLIEAMGLGLPVVAASVEGVREVLGALADEQAVPWGNDKAFVDAVCEIFADPSRRARLGGDNRKRVQSDFSLQAMIAKYEELYSS